MKAIFFLFLCFLTLNQGVAQLMDDFSDNNFSENPSWQGNTDRFTVNAGELQLFDTAPESSNTSFLSVPALTSTSQATTWEFYFSMEFAPSASNYARIYLSASNSDLSGSQQGYYIKAGGITGSDDAIELYRQDDNNSTLLFSGIAGTLGNTPATSRVKIVRTTEGEWSVFTDYNGGTDYELEGTVTDLTYPMGNFFGFYCEYTSTRSEDFFFDNVLIDPLYEDVQPPLLIEAEAQSATSILVTFNENVSALTAENPAHYFIDHGIGNPVQGTLVPGNPNMVLLETATPLINLVNYSVTVSNIEDLAGNVLTNQATEFTFLNIQAPAENEIIITEIMADNSPAPAGLPGAEYIEIFNNSNHVFQLSELKFSVNGSQKSLPEHLLIPGQYVTICDDEFLSAFQNFGPAVALASFPPLTNGSGQLLILDENGAIVFEVNYSDTWYGNSGKSDGGWSLEMIDLNNVYDCSGNWRASNDPDGGTPGKENSLFGQPLETEGPVLRTAYAESSFELLVTFDEAIDETTVSPTSFSISDGISIFNAFVQHPETNTIVLTLSTPLSLGVVYSLTAAGSIADCLGNTLQSEGPVYFGLPQAAEANDIVVNEILFDPETFGTDFLELYNRSDKIFDLDDIYLVNFQKEDTAYVGRHLLFPGEYVVFSEVPEDIQERYFVEFPDRLVKNDLPGFDNNAGNVTIKYNDITIDSFDYNEQMHFGLLTSKEGISLERLSPEAPTQSFGNWHSAASSAGYATPTYKNSQFSVPVEPGSSILSIPNTTFSPDNDGYEDILQISYATDLPGFFINLYIYDALGRPIRQIAANELLAAQGVYKWDGTTEDGQKARLGIYIVWAELFTTEGKVEQFKETCVLAGQLD